MVERQPGAVSLKSCTWCTDLDFTRRATTFSRNINYDVTQRRPEGAARLHTPKNVLHPLLSDESKQNRSNRAGMNGRGRKGETEGGNGSIFSFSYIDDSNIPPASKISSPKQKFHRKLTCLKFNGRRADMHMGTNTQKGHTFKKAGSHAANNNSLHL